MDPFGAVDTQGRHDQRQRAGAGRHGAKVLQSGHMICEVADVANAGRKANARSAVCGHRLRPLGPVGHVNNN